ncbi:hypothetical protein RBB50_001460 [Rhinocladiella similis]
MNTLNTTSRPEAPVEDKTIALTGSLSTRDLIDYENSYGAASLKPLPIVLTKAQGALLWDLDGNRYIDFLSSFSVTNQGHCHPRLVKAMVDQCQKLTIASRAMHNEHYPLLCKRLCNLLGFDKALAMNSGSEATDTAIKIARKWGYCVKGIDEDKAKIITLSGNYHGKLLGPLSASDNPKITKGFGPYLPGVGPKIGDRTVRFNNLEDMTYAFENWGHEIAGVMVECVQGYAGCLPAKEEYINGVYALCKKYNSLFIADEIQSGFGRAGYLMSYQKYNVRPDMITIGKALTGGVYAMGMVLGTNEVMSQLQPGEHSSTFSANPIASAVALEAVDVVLDEQLPERSLRLGAALIKRLSAIQTADVKTRVTGSGLFCSFNIEESHPPGRVTAAKLTEFMRKRGVMIYSVENRLRIAPPLTIQEKHLWRGVDILESSLQELSSV